MKKICFILVTFIFCFGFVSNVYASPKEVDAAKKATEEYCEEDAPKSGCLYDANDSLYTKSGKISNENLYAKITINENIPLTRGYQAANADGKMIFAGCYKYELNVSEPYYFDNGTYFVFKIVEQKGNNCNVVASDIVPAKGIVSRGHLLGFPVTLDPYDGRNGIGGNSASYEWTAINNGACPLMFGLTANTRWYTSQKNRYIFADDESGFSLNTFSFWGNEKYEQAPGCTIMDNEGYKEAKACFDNAISKINNYTCPSDTTKIVNMTETLASYQDECKNKFKLLYSKGLLENQAEEFSNKMKEAANEKVNSCYYSKCNITASQQSKINSAISGKECENGCTSTTGTCIECLKNAYTSAGLSETQKTCLLKIEEEKQGVIDTVNDTIDEQFQNQVEKDLAENEEVRENIENYVFSVNLPDMGFGESKTTCAELLGANLTKIVDAILVIIRIAGAVLAVVFGMLALVPAVVSKDQDALKKAGKKCVNMGIVLVLILLLPSLLVLIGNLFGYDLSCIV